MKRTVALATLGLGVAAAASTAFGQAAFLFSNYAEPYIPITYEGVTPVEPDSGVQIEVWWAPGADAPEITLALGDYANWSSYAGYTDRNQLFTISDFSTVGGSPSIYTVQLRASGTVSGIPVDTVAARGPLVNVPVYAQDVSPPEVPLFTRTPGFMLVPEPATLSLAGLGAAALLIVRRRN